MVRSPLWVTITTQVPVGRSGSMTSRASTPYPISSMSRFRPAMSAPRRPTKATSPPSAAIQAAMLAPDPPPCIVTLAGVSLPRASGSIAWATVSVIRSPMTTTRAIAVLTSQC